MSQRTNLILYFGLYAVSVGLNILAVFVWEDPPMGTWENFFHALCSDQLFLVLGVDGVLKAKKQKAEQPYAQAGKIFSWIMIVFFCLALARNFYVLFS